MAKYLKWAQHAARVKISVNGEERIKRISTELKRKARKHSSSQSVEPPRPAIPARVLNGDYHPTERLFTWVYQCPGCGALAVR